VAAFGGVQMEKLDPHGAPALLMNLAGAILVLISLIFAFNLASFALETVWASMATYGLIKLLMRRKSLSSGKAPPL
jgi:hypothetical protein